MYLDLYKNRSSILCRLTIQSMSLKNKIIKNLNKPVRKKQVIKKVFKISFIPAMNRILSTLYLNKNKYQEKIYLSIRINMLMMRNKMKSIKENQISILKIWFDLSLFWIIMKKKMICSLCQTNKKFPFIMIQC